MNKKKIKEPFSFGDLVAALIAVAIIVAMIVSFSGCSPKIAENISEHTSVEKKDSTYYRDTTIYVPIPLENGQVITRANEKARAETSIAEAEAFVDTLGFLHLDIRNKPVHLSAVVAIPHRSIWVNTTAKKEQLKQLVVHVEKPLNWWQKFRINSFWWLLAAVIVLVAWCTRKLWLRI